MYIKTSMVIKWVHKCFKMWYHCMTSMFCDNIIGDNKHDINKRLFITKSFISVGVSCTVNWNIKMVTMVSMMRASINTQTIKILASSFWIKHEINKRLSGKCLSSGYHRSFMIWWQHGINKRLSGTCLSSGHYRSFTIWWQHEMNKGPIGPCPSSGHYRSCSIWW